MKNIETDVLEELMAEMGAMDGMRAMKHKGRMPLLEIEISTMGGGGKPEMEMEMENEEDDEEGMDAEGYANRYGMDKRIAEKMMAKNTAR